MERGIRLIGNGQAPVHMYWEKLLEMVRQDKIDPLRMVTHRIQIEELAEAYRAFDQKEDKMQKIFVETKFSSPPCPGAPQLGSLLKS
jgi:threonine dehydrogenase-like Zn-dependent dehydrogenase